MYCNVYVPQLQREGGVVAFFRYHRGYPFASSVLMDPISEAFVAAIHAFVQTASGPLITFPPDRRKEDVAAAHRADCPQEEGVVVLGRAQEKTPGFRTEKRRNPRTSNQW